MQGMMMDRPLLISAILQHAVRSYGEVEVVSRDGDRPLFRYTYGAMARRVNRLANALRDAGVSAGTRVATLAWNDYRHLEAYYAVPGIGAVLHTCNPRLHPAQLAWMLNDAEDSVLLFDPAFLPLVEAIAPHCPHLRKYVVLDTALPERTTLANLLSYEQWIGEYNETFAWPEFDERQASGLCYTSGTTGNPKGVLYSHRSAVLHSLVLSNAQALGLSSADTVLPVVPMFHVNAWGLPYAAPLNGCRLVLPGARLDGASLFDLIESEKVTFSAGVPTVWLSLAQHMEKHGVSPTTMRRTVLGGSAVPETMIRTFAEAFDVEVRQAWGMTETSPLGTIMARPAHDANACVESNAHVATSQGHAVFGVELAIAGPDGKRLPHDGQSQGELLIRGPWIASGYLNHEAKPLIDGWFATGDVATIDASGNMRITDRIKDVIKSGGEWISSIDLESAAMAHPEVALAAAIGVPHPKWAERPYLYVLRRPGSSLDATTLSAFLTTRIAKWWVPEGIEFVDELPLGATGKVQKQILRQRAHATGETDADAAHAVARS
ncbi:long-chain-fatty-acid--CoA ligase [Paraburkholderia sp. C35]|uniref:long-chain-fatty-acid--CoA ligase n=1 Tax=Paraburkholderia sp. C35 TaxID=2126993 RepID=UPI00194F3ECC|nr:long-chain-fatty-acid--CoA ligase [Paraburkholderia sp. C35]